MDLGIFYILAVSSLATYGILLAGFFYFEGYRPTPEPLRGARGSYFTNYKNSLSYVSKIYYKINKTLAVASAGTLSNSSPSFKNVFFTGRGGALAHHNILIYLLLNVFFILLNTIIVVTNKNNQDNNSLTFISVSYLDSLHSEHILALYKDRNVPGYTYR